MTSRIEVSIKFIIVCWISLAITLSSMVKIFYHTDIKQRLFPTNNEFVETIACKSSSDIIIAELTYNIESTEGLIEESNLEQLHTNEIENVEVVFEDTGYKYGKRIDPAVEINIPDESDMRNFTGTVDTSKYQYLGSYNITGYTPGCSHCCGNVKGITASGVEAISGYTIAAPKNIPFGTTLYIEGYGYYVVEDRGNFPDTVIDIAAPNHDACYTLTGNGIAVYVVPNNSTTN